MRNTVARPLKKAYSAGWHLANLGRIAAGDGKAAERQRSRSEADTGQRTGACFGLCCFSGAKTAVGFRAALGRALGWNLGRERVARFAESPASSPSGEAARGEWATGRTRQKRRSFCDPTGRAGRTPPTGRNTPLCVESCRTSRASAPLQSRMNILRVGVSVDATRNARLGSADFVRLN